MPETKKGSVTAISQQNRAVQIDGVSWHQVSDKLKFEWIKKGLVEYATDELGNIVFIKSNDSSARKANSYQKGNSEEIQKMSEQKNKINARIAALTNATNVCIANKETEKVAVITLADEFLAFIEGSA